MSPTPRIPPHRRAALAVGLALAACAGSSAPEPISCSERAECPGDAFCRDGACVQSAPPVARIASLGGEAPRVNRVLAFDASASGDPDGEDQVVGFAWRAKPVSAACEPTDVEAIGASYRVLFPCPGQFLVEVTVTDSAGISSAPATLALNVAPDESPAPMLFTGAALTLDHRCGGEPLECTPVAEGGATSFELSATSSAKRGPVAMRWTASAPAGLQTQHAVAFSDETAAAPVVALRTSGAIAGTWTFQVVAVDADGRAAVAQQKVTIGNRPPVLTAPLAPLAVHHRYDAAGASYVAEGRFSAASEHTDPDGDRVSVRFAGEASGDGGHGFALAADGAFSIRIPAAEPQHLIGEGVARRITVEADDGNGGRVTEAVALTVLNRAPRVAVSRSVATVPHTYDAARRVYTAAATLSDYVDDDGDPMLPGSAFEQDPAGCATLSLSGATLGLTCEVPLGTIEALATLARPHVLDVTVRDPWAESPRTNAWVDVTNRPPYLTTSYVLVKAPSRTTNVCCWWDTAENACGAFPRQYEAGDASFSSVEDPDGDPLDVTYEPTSAALLLSRTSASACIGAECAVGLHLDAAGSLDACVEIPEAGQLRVDVTDGASSYTLAIPVWRSDW